MSRRWVPFTLAAALFLLSLGTVTRSQDKSVKPGINDPFKNPDVEKFAKTFEGESREVYALREKIVAACKPAGDGRGRRRGRDRTVHPPVRAAVEPKGKVIAVTFRRSSWNTSARRARRPRSRTSRP